MRQLLNIIRQVGFDRVEFVVGTVEGRREAVIEGQIFTPPGVKLDPADLITVPERRETPRSAAPPPPPPPPPPPSARPRVLPVEIPTFPGLELVVEVLAPRGGADQAVALNTRAMTLSKLGPILSSHLEQTPDKGVCIKPARAASYADVIAVMEGTRLAGAEPLLVLIDEVTVPRGLPSPSKAPPVIGGVTGGVPGGVPEGIPDGAVLRRSGGELARSAIRRVEAQTPPMAKTANVSGPVVVEVTVDEGGDVIKARAISGHPLLREAAAEAARGWKFTPVRVSGEPVLVIGTLTFNFK